MSNNPVTEPQKFAGDLFWVAASNLTIPLVGLITLPALTKNYPAATYAAWIQSVFVVWLISFVLNLGLGNAMVRFLAAEDDIIVRRRSIGIMLWPTLAFSCLIILSSVFFRQDISKILFATSDYAYLVPLIFVWAATEAVFSLLISYLLARRSIKRMSIIQLSLTIFKMAVIVIMAVMGCNLEWIMCGTVVGVTIFATIVLIMIVKEIGWPWPAMAGLKGYMAFSIPLMPGGILFWAISVSDRYFITNLLNLSQAGVYSASFSICTLMSVFYSPIQVALFPVLSRLWEQKQESKVRNYLEYSNKLFLTLAIPGAAGLCILSQQLLGILSTPDYMAGGGLVLLITLAIILSGLFHINVFVILLVQQTKWLMPIIAAAAVVNIGVNLALIPIFGIIGAAIASVMSYLILAVIVIAWARKVISYNIGILFLAKVIIGASLMAFCISFIHVSGIFGIVAVAVAGVIIFSLWMWLARAFSTEDWKLIKEIIMGLRQGALLR